MWLQKYDTGIYLNQQISKLTLSCKNIELAIGDGVGSFNPCLDYIITNLLEFVLVTEI